MPILLGLVAVSQWQKQVNEQTEVHRRNDALAHFRAAADLDAVRLLAEIGTTQSALVTLAGAEDALCRRCWRGRRLTLSTLDYARRGRK